MAENHHPASEPIQKGMQAAHTVNGAVKTGKAIATAAKGTAAGGPYGAVAGFLWENRKIIGKIIIAAVAFMMIPVMLVCMLPSAVFGGLDQPFSPENPNVPILNDGTVVMKNLSEIYTKVNGILSEARTDLSAQIDTDFTASGAAYMEIVSAEEETENASANIYLSQYCAANNKDYQSVSVSDMEKLMHRHKDKLYSYTRALEDRTKVVTTVTVDAATGKETVTETVITEKWAIYTVTYTGKAYFADSVFHLTDKQKELADHYAENLALFLRDSRFQNQSSNR